MIENKDVYGSEIPSTERTCMTIPGIMFKTNANVCERLIVILIRVQGGEEDEGGLCDQR